jgi:WD repeat and SOF domain-containing protein 1
MELFSLGSFQVKPREKTALRVNAKLIEKFEHHPHIKKIQRHRHVPKHVYNARNELRSGRIAARRKYMRIYFF